MNVKRQSNLTMNLKELLREVEGYDFRGGTFPKAKLILQMLLNGVPLPGVLLRASDLAGPRTILRGLSMINTLHAIFRRDLPAYFVPYTGAVYIGTPAIVPPCVPIRDLMDLQALGEWRKTLTGDEFQRLCAAHDMIREAVLPVTIITCDDEAATLAMELG